jgi:hypothetical protein
MVGIAHPTFNPPLKVNKIKSLGEEKINVLGVTHHYQKSEATYLT